MTKQKLSYEEMSKIYQHLIKEKFELVKKYRGLEEAQQVVVPYANAICEFLSVVSGDASKLKKIIK